jgi:hypothetical protein
MRLINKVKKDVWVNVTNTGNRWHLTKLNEIRFKETPADEAVVIVVNNQEIEDNVLLLSAIDARLKDKNQQPLSMEEWVLITDSDWSEETVETYTILSDTDAPQP